MLFWSKVLTSCYDGRLLRRIATAAVRLGRGTWIAGGGAIWVEGYVQVLQELLAV